MITSPWDHALREVTGVRGVVGAVIISADDGLVVAERSVEDLATSDVAALVAAVIGRATRCATAVATAVPASIHIVTEQGAVLAVAGPEPLWMVAVTRHDAELGRVRLLLRDFAGTLH